MLRKQSFDKWCRIETDKRGKHITDEHNETMRYTIHCCLIAFMLSCNATAQTFSIEDARAAIQLYTDYQLLLDSVGTCRMEVDSVRVTSDRLRDALRFQVSATDAAQLAYHNCDAASAELQFEVMRLQKQSDRRGKAMRASLLVVPVAFIVGMIVN